MSRIQGVVRGMRVRREIKKKEQGEQKQIDGVDYKYPEKRILAQLKTILQRKGFQLESLFRICDTKSNGQVTFQQFQNAFTNLKIHFSQSQIKRFLLMFDEDCNGVISRNEFNHALQGYFFSYYTFLAYGNQEILKIGNQIHLTEFQKQAFIKFVQILKEREIGFNEIFNMCDQDANGGFSIFFYNYVRSTQYFRIGKVSGWNSSWFAKKRNLHNY